jgi:hypothetical protein
MGNNIPNMFRDFHVMTDTPHPLKLFENFVNVAPPAKKKSLRGLMYQVLGWVKSSTEL